MREAGFTIRRRDEWGKVYICTRCHHPFFSFNSDDDHCSGCRVDKSKERQSGLLLTADNVNGKATAGGYATAAVRYRGKAMGAQ